MDQGTLDSLLDTLLATSEAPRTSPHGLVWPTCQKCGEPRKHREDTGPCKHCGAAAVSSPQDLVPKEMTRNDHQSPTVDLATTAGTVTTLETDISTTHPSPAHIRKEIHRTTTSLDRSAVEDMERRRRLAQLRQQQEVQQHRKATRISLPPQPTPPAVRKPEPQPLATAVKSTSKLFVPVDKEPSQKENVQPRAVEPAPVVQHVQAAPVVQQPAPAVQPARVVQSTTTTSTSRSAASSVTHETKDIEMDERSRSMMTQMSAVEEQSRREVCSSTFFEACLVS